MTGTTSDQAPASCPRVADMFDSTVPVVVMYARETRFGDDHCWETQVTVPHSPTQIRYTIRYINRSSVRQNEVAITVKLDDNLYLVPDTLRVISSLTDGWTHSYTNAITSDGVIIGNFEPGADAFLQFDISTPDPNELPCGDNALRSVVSADSPESEASMDAVDIVISHRCPTSSASPTTA